MSACPSIRPLLVRSVEGELAPRAALRLARHLDGCTACRILLARERRLAQMLDRLDDVVPVDASFFDAVMASLPERPCPTGTASRRERFRRGLRLAGLSAAAVAGGGLAARFLPFLRFDLPAPAMPRFAAEESESWMSIVGSAGEWVRLTAQTLSLSLPSGSLGARLVLTLAVEAILVAAVVALATSAVAALRRGPDSPAS